MTSYTRCNTCNRGIIFIKICNGSLLVYRYFSIVIHVRTLLIVLVFGRTFESSIGISAHLLTRTRAKLSPRTCTLIARRTPTISIRFIIDVILYIRITCFSGIPLGRRGMVNRGRMVQWGEGWGVASKGEELDH